MWESVLQKERWEIQVNPDYKIIRLHVISKEENREPVTLQIGQTELFELMHAFLAINRAFNAETMYYDDPTSNHANSGA
ncbi:hypothetical protein CBW46_005630 [Paenibacillus xerothermodurans]|uniref:Uncharacterized protein n=2 Tax=Paenibacillus xerothermodurans TaxID=1977292 RepID=A0A2W1NT84_PAEXE|nr:hypothetical protein CBW46_005630 [Paenibacillus xerothermodurans]